MEISMKKIIATLGIVVSMSLLQGCATGATVAGMTSSKTVPSLKSIYAEGITVAPVVGGKSTNPLGTSQVGSKEFEGALRSTLSNNGILASGNSRYVLYPELKKLKQPMFGLNFTVTADVNYVLKNQASGQEVMNKLVVSSSTATVGDSINGVQRLRIANEGAIRENIELLLQRLAETSSY